MLIQCFPEEQVHVGQLVTCQKFAITEELLVLDAAFLEERLHITFLEREYSGNEPVEASPQLLVAEGNSEVTPANLDILVVGIVQQIGMAIVDDIVGLEGQKKRGFKQG